MTVAEAMANLKQVIDGAVKHGLFSRSEDVCAAVESLNTIGAALSQAAPPEGKKAEQ